MASFILILVAVLPVLASRDSPQLFKLSQVHLNRVVSSLNVRYDVIDNVQTSLQDKLKTYLAQITLANKGQDIISKGDWALYFCHIRMIEEQYTAHAPDGYLLPEGHGLKVTHINGCLFKFSPTNDFQNLNPGNSIRIMFNASFWCVAKTDVMPNWYMATDSLQARTVTSTAGEGLEFVGPFDSKNKWKRYPSDRYNPYTAKQRYDMCDVDDMGKPPNVIIPSPLNISRYDTTAYVNINTGDWIVVAQKELTKEAHYLAVKLGINEVTTGATSRVFRLIYLNIQKIKVNNITNQEAYQLSVDTNKAIITIIGNNPSGVFWGVQSLLSITREGRVPEIFLTDAPRFEFRGMHIDVARNFFEKNQIFKLIDVMSMYKLNKLHLHLTDDEGWRLEIPGLPELTTVGGRRCHNRYKQQSCITSQLGSGPFTGNTGSGFYTTRDYQDILQYANDRHIQVIPEFDMPGHAHAAVKAMEERHRNLSNIGQPESESKRFLLSESQDKSKYLSAQLFKDNAINPCIESTYTFIQKLVEAVKNLHNSTQPLEIFHFGGDEVPLGAWVKSPSCQDLAAKLGINLTAPSAITYLKRYFVRRVSNITSKYGIDLAAWEDGLLGADETPYQRSYVKNKNVYANAWDNVWEWKKATRPYRLANAGYKVVMTQATHLFFDHPYEPDPEERGYYWAPRFIDTRKTFGFMPDDLYANADYKRNGEKIVDVCKDMYENKCEELRKPENIAGISGALWTETIRTPKELDHMIYPRLLALAERAWHKAAWEEEKIKAKREEMKRKDWERFVNTLGYKELSRLDEMNVAYRVPPPGAKFVANKLHTKSLVPGLTVQYTKDDGKTWSDVHNGAEFANVAVKLATRSADRRRTSRLIDARQDDIKSSSSLPQAVGGLTLVLLMVQIYINF